MHNPAEMPRELEVVEEPYVKRVGHRPEGVRRRGDGARERAPRQLRPSGVPHRGSRAPHLRAPARRDRLDFYDQLKSRTRGYAGFDYDLTGFREGELVTRRHPRRWRAGGRALAHRPSRRGVRPRARSSWTGSARRSPASLRRAVQAAIGSRVIARETIKAKRKDVLAKCYGGDITRKRKLLEKQKEGKKRMKQVGGGRGAAGGVPRGAQPRTRTGSGEDRGRTADVGVRHLYVHLPFCVHRCGYCDFVTVVGRRASTTATSTRCSRSSRSTGACSRRAARDALPRRRDANLHRARRAPPSARGASRFGRGDRRGEPRDGDARARRAPASAGVDRVSLGAQSFQPRLLEILERRASPEVVRRAVRVLRGAGFDNISLDLVYGIPGQTPPISIRISTRLSGSRPSTSPATSSRRSAGPASRTPTVRSSSGRPRRWRATSSVSSRR